MHRLVLVWCVIMVATVQIEVAKALPFALNDNEAIYSCKWSPKIIVIGLGENDFSTPLKVEKMADPRSAGIRLC
jgi:hypothetical protein